MKRLDAEFPSEINLHLVMDNYGTHKHPKVRERLQRHPRFVTHFILASSSWLNLIERWFGELAGKRIRHGIFVSVANLVAAIEDYLTTWNTDQKPFCLDGNCRINRGKMARCKQTQEKIQPGCTTIKRSYRTRKINPVVYETPR